MASLLVVLYTCLIIFMASPNTCVEAAGKQFKVGGSFGWHEPSGPNNTELYIQWAESNRFQIGDALVFEYQNDSVLSVEKVDYVDCDTSNPITAFNNGKSTFNLDRPGNFYFISGTSDHCKNGQKLLVDVMHPHPILKSPPPISIPPLMAPPPSDHTLEEVSSASLVITPTLMSHLVTFVCVMMLLAH